MRFAATVMALILLPAQAFAADPGLKPGACDAPEIELLAPDVRAAASTLTELVERIKKLSEPMSITEVRHAVAAFNFKQRELAGVGQDELPESSIFASTYIQPESPLPFSEQFLAQDPQTGRLLPCTLYRIDLEDGRFKWGWTDSEGKSARIETASPQRLEFKLVWLQSRNVEFGILPAGVVQVEARDTPNFLLLDVVTVKRGHSFAIDSGEDVFSTLVLHKQSPTRLVEEVPAKTNTIPGTSIQLEVGTGWSCIGEWSGERFRLLDLAGKVPRVVANKKIKAGTFDVSFGARSAELKVVTTRPLAAKDKRPTASCDIGEQVWIDTSTYKFQCAAKWPHNCRLATKMKSEIACEPIGGCD